MKYCPSCLSQYSDLTLKFCLQDGTPLSSMPLNTAEPKQSSIDTVAFLHPVTAMRLNQTQDVRLPEPAPAPARPRVNTGSSKSGGRGKILALLGIPALMILGAAAVFGWLYYERGHTASGFSAQLPPQEPSKPQLEEVPAAVTQPSSNSDLKKEIADLVEAWKLSIESRKAPAVVALYGEKVDYLGNPEATPKQIAEMLQKTFDLYNDVDLDITDLSIAMSDDAATATALFDREWSYAKTPELVEGKAHTRLRFEKLAGSGWRIVGEKDLKVYFEEK